jgi:hypothetical protein
MWQLCESITTGNGVGERRQNLLLPHCFAK